MNYDLLSQTVATYVRDFFKQKEPGIFVYHNIRHTEEVVAAANKIGNHYQLGESDFFIITTAAWFHDTGYYIDPLNHERSGADLAAKFLEQQQVPEPLIVQVRQCILATHMPQDPKNELEAMVCDADLFHLGTDDFKERNKSMREEFSKLKGIPISKQQWRLSTLAFLEGHHY
ncbi:MAG: HD domain-containing protein, partial [Sphingobacterium sp.]